LPNDAPAVRGDASRILMTSFRRRLLPASRPRYDESSRPVILQASSLPAARAQMRRAATQRRTVATDEHKHSDDDLGAAWRSQSAFPLSADAETVRVGKSALQIYGPQDFASASST